MSDAITDKDMALIDKAAQDLGEHFDTVQIFVTRYEPETEGGTIHRCTGRGNWFAIRGQIMEWMLKHDEGVRQSAQPRDEE